MSVVVLPDRSGIQVMDAIVACSGLAVSENGIVCSVVQVAFCGWCEIAHPISHICADVRAAPEFDALEPLATR